MTPALTVVTPTRDRVASVLRLLRALGAQEPPDGGFEVVVVADGCTDGSAHLVRAHAWPFDVHVIEIPAAGPATARNCGAAAAHGDILLFLDDDVEPQPGVLRAHALFHRAVHDAFAIGYLPPIVSSSGLLASALRGWWESMFDGPRRPAHRYTFRDLLSGHVSVRRAHFEALGGFDATLRCHEDWELGYRALQAGLQLRFAPDAVAWHHDDSDLAKTLGRKFAEGVADIQLLRLHPELAPSLPVGWWGTEAVHRRSLARLAWRSPRTGDRIVRQLTRLLPLLETWRLRFRWRALLEHLMTYWYWRGIAETAGTIDALDHLLAMHPTSGAPEMVVDLAEGLEAVLAQIDGRRPRSLRIVHGSDLVGELPERPGSEPLRAAHVRRALAGSFARQTARALARDGTMPPILAASLVEPSAESRVAARTQVVA